MSSHVYCELTFPIKPATPAPLSSLPQGESDPGGLKGASNRTIILRIFESVFEYSHAGTFLISNCSKEMT